MVTPQDVFSAIQFYDVFLKMVEMCYFNIMEPVLTSMNTNTEDFVIIFSIFTYYYSTC